ncbi:MAG TPA: hypothetical protein VL461_08310 [Dictyobacter sp.]|jgi:hypothetical protein|nr:hypothetical protein [Dictyobacter sp.]
MNSDEYKQAPVVQQPVPEGVQREQSRRSMKRKRLRIILFIIWLLIPVASLLVGFPISHAVVRSVGIGTGTMVYVIFMWICVIFTVIDIGLIDYLLIRNVVWRFVKAPPLRIILAIVLTVLILVLAVLLVTGLLLAWTMGSDGLGMH